MDLDRLAMLALMGNGVAQYPDVKLYKAASLLTPEERPQGPVRFLDPAHPLLRVNPSAAGTVDFKNNTILMKKGSPEYDNPDSRVLASLMAHEAEHMREGETPPGGHVNEHGAYKRQYEVLRRLGYQNTEYMQKLADRVADEAVAMKKASRR